MCGSVVIFPRWFIGAVIAGAVIFFPITLIGAAGFGAVTGVQEAKFRLRRRKVRKYWNRVDTITGGKASPLQQLWDAYRLHRDTFATFRLAFAFLTADDIVGACYYFNEAYEQERYANGKYVAPAAHHVAMCRCQLQQWDSAIEELQVGVRTLATPPVVYSSQEENDNLWKQHKAGAAEAAVTLSDVRGLLAYAILMKATRGETMDVDAIAKALEVAEQAFAEDPSNARHAYVAAWCLFYLGLRADEAGKTVTVDEGHLKRALTLTDLAKDAAARAEREVNAAIISEYGDRAQAAVAAVVTSTGVVDGAVVPKQLEPLPDQDGDEDDDKDADTNIEADVTGEGAAGVTIAEILSLQAQIHLALGQATEAATVLAAARTIDPVVSHSSLSTDADDTDPRIGLLAPWPLPKGPTGETVEQFQQHKFEKCTLLKPTWCSDCAQRIKGFKGLRCTVCNFTVHGDYSPSCLQHASAHRCLATASAASETSSSVSSHAAPTHQHVFRQRRIHTPHDCMQCGTFIMMMKHAVQCTVCQSFAHLKCVKGVPNAILDHEPRGAVF